MRNTSVKWRHTLHLQLFTVPLIPCSNSRKNWQQRNPPSAYNWMKLLASLCAAKSWFSSILNALTPPMKFLFVLTPFVNYKGHHLLRNGVITLLSRTSTWRNILIVVAQMVHRESFPPIVCTGAKDTDTSPERSIEYSRKSYKLD